MQIADFFCNISNQLICGTEQNRMRTTRKIRFSAAKAENVPVATFVEHSLSLLQIQKSLSYFFLILAVCRLLQFFLIYIFRKAY